MPSEIDWATSWLNSGLTESAVGIPLVIRQVNPRSIVHTPNLRELFFLKKRPFWKILIDEKKCHLGLTILFSDRLGENNYQEVTAEYFHNHGQTAEIGLDGDPQGETLAFLGGSQI